MCSTVAIIISFLVGLAITLLYGHYQRKKKPGQRMEDQVEYPRIARVQIHPYCCKTCGKPMNNNDLVVWAEKNSGWKSDPSHAECLIFIRQQDGTITRLDGESIKTYPSDGIVDPLPIGSFILTEDEWDDWSSSKDVEIVVPRA